MTSIVVVGATGRTGRLIVERALAAGHHVTAIARRPETLPAAPRLTRVAADVNVPGALRGLLDDHEAVISALGSAGRGPTLLYSAGTAEIISAMKPGGRLIVISSAGLATPADAGPGTRLFARLLHRLMRHPYADMTRMERLLADNGLVWTAVRPTRLTDRPATGSPRVSIGATARVGNQTSRGDLAALILDAVHDPRTHRTIIAVSS